MQQASNTNIQQNKFALGILSKYNLGFLRIEETKDCLFTCVATAVLKDSKAGSFMRKKAVETVLQQWLLYDSTLRAPYSSKQDYETRMTGEAFGGLLELHALAVHCRVTIHVHNLISCSSTTYHNGQVSEVHLFCTNGLHYDLGISLASAFALITKYDAHSEIFLNWLSKLDLNYQEYVKCHIYEMQLLWHLLSWLQQQEFLGAMQQNTINVKNICKPIPKFAKGLYFRWWEIRESKTIPSAASPNVRNVLAHRKSNMVCYVGISEASIEGRLNHENNTLLHLQRGSKVSNAQLFQECLQQYEVNYSTYKMLAAPLWNSRTE